MEEKNHCDIFNSIFKSKGGVFTPTDVDTTNRLNTLKVHVESIISYVKMHYPALPDIYFDYIDNLTLNAGAAFYKENYYIGLNIGAKIIFGELFNCELSTATVLKNIGNASIDKGERKVNIINIGGSLSIDLQTKSSSKSEDPLRAFYADYFSQLATEFVIFHELGHVIRGHCGYKSSITKKLLWLELDVNEIQDFTAINSQTLEMDADSFAVNHAIITAYNSISAYDNLSSELKTIYSNIETFLCNWIFCIFSFFKLCNIITPGLKDHEKNSHPHPSLRISLILNNIAVILHNRGESTTRRKEIINALIETIKHADFAFSEVTFEVFNHQIFVDNFFQTSDFSKTIRDNWNNVLPLIKSFAIDPNKLPPPV